MDEIFECKNHTYWLRFDTREKYILHLSTDIARVKAGEDLGKLEEK